MSASASPNSAPFTELGPILPRMAPSSVNATEFGAGAGAGAGEGARQTSLATGQLSYTWAKLR
ncbi:MAG: hypothetical protein LCH36_07365 [Actinobacteria bacterium]|nr:hypothetical protein [Actinomycetota bacterium]